METSSGLNIIFWSCLENFIQIIRTLISNVLKSDWINALLNLSGTGKQFRASLHKKWSFPLTISSINVAKSAVSCGLVTFTEETLDGKLHFFVQSFKLRYMCHLIILCYLVLRSQDSVFQFFNWVGIQSRTSGVKNPFFR